uniref:Uncharacterized protein n=1 Tax=Clastoptera arizonana TaxID=38151 RepID=A0A1B6DB37_9HEMI
MAIGGIIPVVLAVVVIWYSALIWRSMDEYFRDEFKKSLNDKYKSHVISKENDIQKFSENIDVTPEENLKDQENKEICNEMDRDYKDHDTLLPEKCKPLAHEHDTCPIKLNDGEKDCKG